MYLSLELPELLRQSSGTRISGIDKHGSEHDHFLDITSTLKESSMDYDEEDMMNSGAEPQAGPSTTSNETEPSLSKKAIKRAAKQVCHSYFDPGEADHSRRPA
jgi:hypothetical protein